MSSLNLMPTRGGGEAKRIDRISTDNGEIEDDDKVMMEFDFTYKLHINTGC